MKVVVAGLSSFYSYLDSIGYAFKEYGCKVKIFHYELPNNYPGYLSRILYKGLPRTKINIFYEKELKNKQEIFISNVVKEKPQLLLVIRGDFISEEVLRRIQESLKTLKTYCWLMDPVMSIPNIMSALRLYDRVFTYEGSDLDLLGNNEISIDYLPLAFDPRYYRPPADSNLKTIKISFIGVLYPNRIYLLEQLYSKLNLKPQDLVIIDGSGKLWPFYSRYKSKKLSWLYRKNIISRTKLSPYEVNNIYSQSAICLNIHRTDITQGYNMRTFEIPGAGGFQLVEELPKLEEIFIPETEIVTYKNCEEMIEKVDYFLNHKKEAERIARNGFQKAKKDHTFVNRIGKMLSYL